MAYHGLTSGRKGMAAITKTFVKGLTSQRPEKPTFTWDDSLHGFGVKQASSGRLTFVVQYRLRGQRQDRRVTLGSFPCLLYTSDAADE